MKSISSFIMRTSFIHRLNNIRINAPSVRHLSTNIDEQVKPNKYDLKNGPSLKDFILNDHISETNIDTKEEFIPYIDGKFLRNATTQRKVFFEVFGCQMNVNDTEIVWSILKKNDYLKTDNIDEADVVLVMTCAIRESAEKKIWSLLKRLRGLKKRSNTAMKIGILGCMAERLKEQLIQKEKAVDLVAGPDSYKDLPRLLAVTENNQTAVNVLLSLDETYADVMPVRLNENSKSAFVSIMRGCDNMCTYCIVPFTRGRERSRPIDSIVEEIKHLSDQGIKEVTLLGQNVNSYRDLTIPNKHNEYTSMAKGFKTVYKVKKGGMRFADLLDKVSAVNPEMRIRFTSPHPKDFPDEVLDIIKERPNICKSLHIPVQSGNSAVLERMRRGYTRESYLELIDHIREALPGVSLSSDFICGFCHETDEEFADTLSLMEMVKYNVAYLFLYSMREKTTAHRRFKDDVPSNVKHKRLIQMDEIFRKYAEELNVAQIGDIQLVLIEKESKRTKSMLAGRNNGNSRVLIPAVDVLAAHDSAEMRNISSGDYVAVKIKEANSQTLRGTPLFHTTLNEFENNILKYNQKLKVTQCI